MCTLGSVDSETGGLEYMDLATLWALGGVGSGTCGLGGAQKELVSSSSQVSASMVRPDMFACLLYHESSEYRMGSMQRVVYFMGSHT